MGTLADKLSYLAASVDDIQAAINEKQIQVDSTIPLGKYGEKIREIQTGSLWADYISLEAFPAFSQEDLAAKELFDVTGKVIVGAEPGIKSRDYLTLSQSTAFADKDLAAKDVADVTETMAVLQKSYTDLLA